MINRRALKQKYTKNTNKIRSITKPLLYAKSVAYTGKKSGPLLGQTDLSHSESDPSPACSGWPVVRTGSSVFLYLSELFVCGSHAYDASKSYANPNHLYLLLASSRYICSISICK
jgi:hypothetical protein